jgi:RNA polymerase sigma-70 factor (ECF subfamily)
MSETHDALIPQIRERDQNALAQYIEGNRWRIMAFIERQLGGALRRKVEPEDIFQETSADAVRALAEIDLTDRDPFGWLCQIAERRIVDAHRRFFGAQKRDAGREVPLNQQRGGTSNVGLIDMLVASMTTPSQAFSRNAREARLMDAIAQLPEEQREALRMRYVESLPSKAIAEKLGKSDAAVRVMLTRSLKKLQTILTEGGQGS